MRCTLISKYKQLFGRQRLFALADRHILASADKVVGSHYSGSHWLASFLMYALERREIAVKELFKHE